MPQLQAVIFDLDGTLIDSAPDLRQALNMMLKENGRRDLNLDEVKSMIGDGALPLVHRAFAATGKALADSESYVKFQSFIAHYRSFPPDPSQIYPHVVETLETLKKLSVKLAICTNKQEAATLQLMEQLNLGSYFDAIVGGDTFPVHKPHPGHVLGTLDRLKVLAPGAVMVGDSANDVLSARGAGVATVFLTHGYGGDVEELQPDVLIDGMKQLSQAFEKLGFKN